MKLYIDYNTTVETTTGIFELNCDVERNDFKALIETLSNNNNLHDLLGNENIANQVLKNLINSSFVDPKSHIENIILLDQQTEEFLRNPYLPSKEKGFYEVKAFSTSDIEGLENNKYILSLKRFQKKANGAKSIKLDDSTYVTGSEIDFENNKVKVTKLNHSEISKYDSLKMMSQIKIELQDRSIDNKYKLEKTLGDTLYNKVTTYLKQQDPKFDFKNDRYTITNKSELKEEFFKRPTISLNNEMEGNKIYVTDIPIYIDDLSIAKRFVYMYLHKKFVSKYYTISQLTTMIETEIINEYRHIFSTKIQSSLLNEHCDMKSFQENLNTAEFEEIEFKLKLLEDMLGIEDVQTEFSRCSTYSEIFQTLNQITRLEKADSITFIQGYGFTERSKSSMKDIFNILSNDYNINIKYIDKGQDKNVDEKFKKDAIKKYNIKYSKNSSIQSELHDRFMVVKSGPTQKIFLCTCEINQLFDKNGKQKGAIMELNRASHMHTYNKILKFLK